MSKGLCPRCLLKLGLASQLSPGFIETGAEPPPFLGFDPVDPSKRTVIEPLRSDSSFLVEGDEGRLGQVLTNLVDNALSFSPAGGTVTLRGVCQPGIVELYVDDEGTGIPDDRLDRIFERFYTDRPGTENLRGKNSGLGLSISREIVAAHAGRIWAENLTSKNGRVRGARFVVQLPTYSASTRGTGATHGRRA